MRKVLTACLLLMSAAVWAQNEKQQNEFDMTAQIRPRAEYRNGALSPRSEGEVPAYFIYNRALAFHGIPSARSFDENFRTACRGMGAVTAGG